MSQARVLVDNAYNTFQYPSNVRSANTEAANREAWRVATGRRTHLTNYWTPTTENVDAWNKVVEDASRTRDMIALDRGHNLKGKVIKLQRSTDDFSASTIDVFTATVPSSTSADGTSLDTANGVLTPEGAWLKKFTGVASQYWRLFVGQVASFKPKVVGLYLGESLELPPLERPYEDDHFSIATPRIQSPHGGTGVGAIAQWRSGILRVALDSAADYDSVADHLRDNFGLHRPMWIVHDQSRAERAVLGVPDEGRWGLGKTQRWGFREGGIPWVEWQPRII